MDVSERIDVPCLDPTWGRLTPFQARGLACAGCNRSFLESERVAGRWVGPLNAIVAGPSPIAGHELLICQDCDEATERRGARDFEWTDLEETP